MEAPKKKKLNHHLVYGTIIAILLTYILVQSDTVSFVSDNGTYGIKINNIDTKD